MWISKKKWNGMKKRIADLEKRVQAQPKEIIEEFAKQLNNQMSKRSVRPQNSHKENQQIWHQA